MSIDVLFTLYNCTVHNLIIISLFQGSEERNELDMCLLFGALDVSSLNIRIYIH